MLEAADCPLVGFPLTAYSTTHLHGLQLGHIALDLELQLGRLPLLQVLQLVGESAGGLKKKKRCQEKIMMEPG